MKTRFYDINKPSKPLPKYLLESILKQSLEAFEALREAKLNPNTLDIIDDANKKLNWIVEHTRDISMETFHE